MPNRVAPELDLQYLEAHDWWANVDRSAGPEACWPWTRSVGSHGYGQTWDGITVRLAHRVAWALTFGQIPAGPRGKEQVTVDHECRFLICCNPTHLRLKTNLANASDNGFATRTHCPRDHPYSEENTYEGPTGGRRCRECARLRRRKVS